MMDKTYSTLLDLLRFFAAIFVFIHHAEQILKDSSLSILASFGHDSVVFFFILSGFVIGFVSKHKEDTLIKYSTARLARLYSVAIPSVLLAFFLVWLGDINFDSDYAKYSNENWFYVFLNSVFFINQSWIGGIAVPTNDPYWSVCYEAWYYIIFGAAFYLSGLKRIIFILLAVSLAGPRIMLLMPIWLAGFFCYKKHLGLKTRNLFGYFCIFVSLFIYLTLRYKNLDDTLFQYSANWFGGENRANDILGFSKRFFPDFIIAGLFVMNLYGLLMIRDDLTCALSRMRPAISQFSDYTFSLYLFHYPLLLFFSHITRNTWASLAASILVIAIIGHFTEINRKYLRISIENILVKIFRLKEKLQ